MQESLQVYLGHVARHAHHDFTNVTNVPVTRKAFSFRKLRTKHQHFLPTDLADMMNQHTPTRLLLFPYFSAPIQSIFGGYNIPTAVLYRCRIVSMFLCHEYHVLIYTDGSTFWSGLAASFVFPSCGAVIDYKLSHRTCLIVAELITIQKALKFIHKKPQTPSTIFLNSKVTLQTLLSVSRQGNYFCLVNNTSILFRALLKSGHTV